MKETKSKRILNPKGIKDDFTSKKVCDRCGADLTTGRRTMSRFNEDVICMKCKEAEQARPDYEQACKAEIEACLAGNYNFKGIGLK